MSENFEINEYVIIDNKDIGKIVKKIWNNIGIIVYLETDISYIDSTIKVNNLLNKKEIQGYKLIIVSSNKIEKLDYNKIIDIYNNLDNFDYSRVMDKIIGNYNNFMNELKNINKDMNNIDENNRLSSINNNSIGNYNDIPIYKEQDMNDDDYVLYITESIYQIFSGNNKILWKDDYYINDTTAIDAIGKENMKAMKPMFEKFLKDYLDLDNKDFYDFKSTLMYKHLIYNEDIDSLSFAKTLTLMIKDSLNKFQEKMILIDETGLLKQANIFDFVTFFYADGYLVLNNNALNIGDRKITEELLPDLRLLSNQYNKEINYNLLMTLVLQNKTESDLLINQDIVTEALKILSQEYCIAFQPRVEILIWLIKRLIITWWTDKFLFKNIYQVKILINLYRSRGIKQLNKDLSIEPIITIVPSYGKTNVRKVMAKLSDYYFPYKKLGLCENRPTFFNSIDELMYYTNGSLELKKYIKYLLKNHKKFNNPLNKDMTKIDIEYYNNSIEYDI